MFLHHLLLYYYCIVGLSPLMLSSLWYSEQYPFLAVVVI